jgi:hypothetical protein
MQELNILGVILILAIALYMAWLIVPLNLFFVIFIVLFIVEAIIFFGYRIKEKRND